MRRVEEGSDRLQLIDDAGRVVAVLGVWAAATRACRSSPTLATIAPLRTCASMASLTALTLSPYGQYAGMLFAAPAPQLVFGRLLTW